MGWVQRFCTVLDVCEAYTAQVDTNAALCGRVVDRDRARQSRCAHRCDSSGGTCDHGHTAAQRRPVSFIDEGKREEGGSECCKALDTA
jgi:hypothetical protein